MLYHLFRIGEKLIRSPFILPIAYLWRFCAWIRNWLYDAQVLKSFSVEVPVLSVGGISLGGSGKTPVVILLAKYFAKRRVAILARGYGDGDELKVIARNCPNAKIYKDPDRVRAAKKAAIDGAEIILLDDGFQHRRLNRDWDLVLIDPTAVLVREGEKRLKNVALVGSFSKEKGAVQFCLKPKAMAALNKKAAIFCGIANPIRFEKMVASMGFQISSKLFLADHEPVNLTKLKKFYEKSGAKQLLCTEKDWVKLPPTNLPIQCVMVDTEVIEGKWEWQAFLAKIDERIDNCSRYGTKFNNSFAKAWGKHPERDCGTMV